MRLAVISDVHGNSFALEAVLADIRAEGADAIVNLGDHLASPIDPRATADMLLALPMPTIRGNHDRWMVTPRSGKPDPIDSFARGQIDAEHLQWLAGLPATLVFEGILLCHGTPASDEKFWLEGFIHARTTTIPDEAAVSAHAAGADYPVILCGHSHIARAVRLRDGRQIVNPGSVGLQIVYGSPDARYVILDRRNGKWSPSFRVVAYDHAAAARAAEAHGFGHWTEALTTGWADPDGLF